ncbi:MAG: FHA domain-containing protein [Acidobacteria bacterium]|nr:FHA domain-containing protein [Acidobacteriota bacterium]
MQPLNGNLEHIEQYLQRAIATQPKLTNDDIDAGEITVQLSEQIRLQQFRWADSKYLPHVLTVHVLEDKPEKIEALEIIFCAPEFTKILMKTAKDANLECLMPIRAEVELVKRNHSALISGSNRCAVTLTWPKLEDTLSLADVLVDQDQRRIIAIHVRRAKMPILARLTALNSEVYRNNYLLIREITHIGRLRVVIDDKTGRFLRRNDFVFAQNDDSEAICNSVSRQHARITYQMDGSFYLEDTGGTNLTRVERVEEGTKKLIDLRPGRSIIRLQHRDIIHLGLAQIRFQIVDHIDPTVLAEISSEQERTIISQSNNNQERVPSVTMRLPVYRTDE